MSTPIDIVGGTLPITCYPGTPNELWAVMWPTLSATLNENFPGIVVSDVEPAPEFQDRIWFNTTNGQWYQFIDGSWTNIPADRQFLSFFLNFYATDTGFANTIVIAFPDRPLDAYAAGLVFWVKVAASNSGATTLKVDSLGVVSVKKYTSAGLTNLEAGDLIAGGIYAFVHDGTQFILINPTPGFKGSTLSMVTLDNSGALYTFPTSATATPPIPHGLGGIPQWVRVVAVCQSGVDGYSANDEIDVTGITVSADGTDQFAAFTVCADMTNITIAAQIFGGAGDEGYIYAPKTGGNIKMDPTKWLLKVYAMKQIA